MIGSHLGNWIIDRELGCGGMGRVYLGHRDPDKASDRFAASQQAALKVLFAELAREEGFLQRFQREIDTLALLDHPNIVRFYESGEHENRYFYAMEYVPGNNFDELLHARSRLPWKEVLDMALQICPALKHAHDHGIIHRDIKTQNLLRTEEGIVKLADFGVAKVFATRHLTATGGLVGTAEYISPEQASGKPVTVRSDLYSFGIVMYTLLTGREPFHGETVLDIMHKHRYAQFDPPRKLVDDVPRYLDMVVCALLEKDPAKRPANALILQRQLESIRRKSDRQVMNTVADMHGGPTKVDSRDTEVDVLPGPATLMSHLMREELESQNRPGPIGRLLNHPLIVAPLFLLCAGLLAWGLWPLDAAGLYEHGAALMQKDDLSDWEKAWTQYFEPLERKYPDHPYAEPLQEHRRRVDDARAERQARAASAGSEAQRFYYQGKRLRKDGDWIAAQRVWQNLVTSFQSVPSEERWVRLADKGLADLNKQIPDDQQRWQSVRTALKQAQALPKEQREKIWQALEELYRDDPSALAIVADIRKQRAQK